MVTDAPNRLERRKRETRRALIGAAQQLVARGEMDAPITTITELADVGTGSFYNHFTTKAELFDAALRAALEMLGALLDELTADIDDPALAFATRSRLLGRLHRQQPELGAALLHTSSQWVRADVGLAPRARRTIRAGIAAGRFTVADAEVAYTVVAGATIGIGQLLIEEPTRDAGDTTDLAVAHLLRVLGVPDEDVATILAQPLPPLPALAFGNGTA